MSKDQAIEDREMGNPETARPAPSKPIRLGTGVVIVLLQWLARFVVPELSSEIAFYSILGGVFIGGLATLVWWIFFSRIPWFERLGALVAIAAGVLLTPPILHESIATGMMGFMFPVFVIPGLSLALVVWAAISGHLSQGPRRVALVAFILIACGGWALVKTGGFGGELDHDFSWRWAATPEDVLLAETTDEQMTPLSTPAELEPEAEWPGFLGPNREGAVHGVSIETDWSASPPIELWRRAVGPGWSSFAVDGDLFYTQEQRGEEEIVACYRLSTGEPVWRHSDPARFWESNAGAGPRGTPTIGKGRVFSFGGTGILNVLDATDGSVFWSRNAASDTEAKLPIWGFSSSPLVVDDLVIVATSGALAAYDIASGERRWARPDTTESYSSPQLFMIDGIAQVLSLNGAGLISVTPSDGAKLWEHKWPGFPIVQPALAPNEDVLISVNQNSGLRRLSVTKASDEWMVKELWTSTRIKPYYSEFVVYNGHAFGFDGSLLACVDLENGKRKWKGGRYGAGQLLLLEDQGLLLVLSEKGELALVSAIPDQFNELARFRAIESKTWNHPVLVGDVLLVRNAQEMAAFRLALVRS